HLAHGRLGSGGQAYFSTFEDLFGDSLDQSFRYMSTKTTDTHYLPRLISKKRGNAGFSGKPF
ncbi:hypothetical protein, partial [Pseudomonas alloputida]|uniref:hypothetical protein n=1 Tax=Pseudomonas alloputida TaxID=1940621 RepID=UPI001E655A9F